MSFKKGIPDIIITFTATDTRTKWSKDRIIDGWSELLTSDNKEVREFAQDLVEYSFFTSGFKKSMYSTFHFIPPSYLKDIGFSKYMGNMRNEFNNMYNYDFLEQVHDDVFQHLWDDDDVVPFVHSDDIGERRRPQKSNGWGEPYATHISIRGKKAIEELSMRPNKYNTMIFKPFIKTKVKNIDYLYKFVGYITNEEGIIEPVYELSQKKVFTRLGKVVKEYGLKRSVITENQAKLLPEGWTDTMAEKRRV